VDCLARIQPTGSSDGVVDGHLGLAVGGCRADLRASLIFAFSAQPNLRFVSDARLDFIVGKLGHMTVFGIHGATTLDNAGSGERYRTLAVAAACQGRPHSRDSLDNARQRVVIDAGGQSAPSGAASPGRADELAYLGESTASVSARSTNVMEERAGGARPVRRVVPFLITGVISGRSAVRRGHPSDCRISAAPHSLDGMWERGRPRPTAAGSSR